MLEVVESIVGQGERRGNGNLGAEINTLAHNQDLYSNPAVLLSFLPQRDTASNLAPIHRPSNLGGEFTRNVSNLS